MVGTILQAMYNLHENAFNRTLATLIEKNPKVDSSNLKYLQISYWCPE